MSLWNDFKAAVFANETAKIEEFLQKPIILQTIDKELFLIEAFNCRNCSEDTIDLLIKHGARFDHANNSVKPDIFRVRCFKSLAKYTSPRLLLFLEKWLTANPGKTLLDFRDSEGKNIFHHFHLNTFYFPTDAENFLKRFPEYQEIPPIPDCFFCEIKKGTKSIPPNARFNPSGALQGEGWEVSNAPSAKPKKKAIFLDRNFANLDQLNIIATRLYREGFRVIYRNFHGYEEAHSDNCHLQDRVIKPLEDNNYEKLLKQFGLAKDELLVLDDNNSETIGRILFRSPMHNGLPFNYYSCLRRKISFDNPPQLHSLDNSRFIKTIVSWGNFDDISLKPEDDLIYLTRTGNTKAVELLLALNQKLEDNLRKDVDNLDIFKEYYDNFSTITLVAIASNNTDILKILFERINKDLNNQNFADFIAEPLYLLCYAAIRNKDLMEPVKKLINIACEKNLLLPDLPSYYIDYNTGQNPVLFNILIGAINHRDTELVKFLLTKLTDKKLSNNIFLTAFIIAIKIENEEIFDIFDKQVNADDFNSTQGHYAIYNSLHCIKNKVILKKIIDRFEEGNKNPKYKKETPNNILINTAISVHNIDAIKMMKGRDLNLKFNCLDDGTMLFTNINMHPLATALLHNNIEAVKELLEWPEIQNPKENIRHHILKAISEGGTKCKKEIIEYLLDYNGGLTYQENKYPDPFYSYKKTICLIVLKGNAEILALMLKTRNGIRPVISRIMLDYAIENKEMLKILLKHHYPLRNPAEIEDDAASLMAWHSSSSKSGGIVSQNLDDIITRCKKYSPKLVMAKSPSSDKIKYDDEKGKFTVFETGEILNLDRLGDLPYKIRTKCSVGKIESSNGAGQYQELTDPNPTNCQDKIARLEKGFNLEELRTKNDRGYTLLKSTIEANKSTRLTSINYHNEICGLKITPLVEGEAVNILSFKHDKFGFYHITTDKPCAIEYILQFDKNPQEVSKTHPIRKILDQYNSAKDGKIPDKSKHKKHGDYLDAVFKVKAGSCGLRVEAFLHKLEKEGKIDICRAVNIEDTHLAIEVSDEGVVKYIDLGGMEAEIEVAENPIDKVLAKAKDEEIKPEEAAPPPETPPPPQVKSLLESYVQKQQERKPVEIKNKTALAQIFKQLKSGGPLLAISNDGAQTMNHLIETAYALQPEPKPPIFCIDDTSKIDIFKQVIKITQTGDDPLLSIAQTGFLHDFIDGCRIYNQTRNEALKPIIMIDWTKFRNQEKVALNTLIDDSPSIDGIKLENFDVISIVKSTSADHSFLSRHKELFIIDIKQEPKSPTDTSHFHRIDLEGYDNWRAKLFGAIYLDHNNQIQLQKSDFITALESGATQLKISNCSNSKSLAELLSRAKALGYFEYHGHKIPLGRNVKVEIDEKDFDFTKFEDRAQIFSDSTINRTPKDCHIINPQIFDSLLLDKKIQAGKYQEFPGLIEKAKGGTLKIFITSQLSNAQYYCLFNQAQKHNVKLDIYIAPKVELPEALLKNNKSLKNALLRPTTEANERLRAAIILSQNCNATSAQAMNNEILRDAIAINVEDCSYQDLITAISYKISGGNKFDDFEEKESEFLQHLKNGQKIILKGEFSTELLQMLEPHLLQDYATNLMLIIENQEKTLPEHLLWLDDQDYHRDQSLNQTPEEKTEKEELIDNANHFETTRKNTFEKLLHDNQMLELVGKSGVGKSHLVNSYRGQAGYEIYGDLGMFKDWAKDKTPGKTKILFIDESNIEDLQLTTFEPLKTGKNKIFYQGKFYEIDATHKVVFARNPLEYGGGRVSQKLFADGKIQKFEMQPMPKSYILKLLKEEIFNKSPLARSLDFKAAMTKEIDKYHDALGQENEITIRELQEYAMRFIYDNSVAKANHPNIVSKDFVSTSATATIENALFSCLELRRLQNADLLPNGGTNGIFLEGMSGIGKSSMVKAYLEHQKIDHIKLDGSLPLEQKKRLIIDAFENGKTIWIDELDSCIDDGLEKILNAALSGNHPDESQITRGTIKPGFCLVATGNGGTFEGRKLISPALRHRLNCPRVSNCTEYKSQDIEKIIIAWLVGDEPKKLTEPLKAEITKIAQEYCALGAKINLRELRDYVLKENEITKNFAEDKGSPKIPPKPSPQQPFTTKISIATEQKIEAAIDSYNQHKEIKKLKIAINNIVGNESDSENFYKPLHYCGMGTKSIFSNYYDAQNNKGHFKIKITEIFDGAARDAKIKEGDIITFEYEEKLSDQELKEFITSIRNLEVKFEKPSKIKSCKITDKEGVAIFDQSMAKRFFSTQANHFIAKEKLCANLDEFTTSIKAITKKQYPQISIGQSSL